MIIKPYETLIKGYNPYTKEEDTDQGMLMDFGLLSLIPGQEERIGQEGKETALLLLEGEVSFSWNGETRTGKRTSCFDGSPVCLHLPPGGICIVKAESPAEVIVQQTSNENQFDAKFYGKEDCKTDIFGGEEWGGTALRSVSTIFDYDSAPYSNMVLGEAINHPGKWSSYPPHSHPQPEIYYYRFNKPQGFGAIWIGDQPWNVTDRSAILIPGDLDHPQTSAPGYAMYFCWMIRHLEGNPWNSRNMNPAHDWLNDKGVKVWPN